MSRKVKFLLVKPTVPQWRVGPKEAASARTKLFRYSMLSSLYVTAAMPSCVESRIVDEEVEPINYDADADLVGLSFMTCNAPRAYEIAAQFKAKGKRVIAGGYHASFLPAEVARHVDAVCIGEAEGAVPRMVDDFLAGALQPVYRSELVDLKGLPVPDRSLLSGRSYATVDTVQATRGCPYHCSFCSISAFFEHRFRARPIDEVIAELKTLGTWLLFMDDNLVADPAYAKELFARMIPLRKRWFSQATVRIAADTELLALAERSGCRGLFIGFESLLDDNLRHWRKSINRAREFESVVKTVHGHGIGVCAGLVFGYDWDTPDVFPLSLDFLNASRVDALQATVLTPFPGTELFRELERQGRVVERDWSQYDFNHVVFEPQKMSRQMLKDGHDWLLARFYARSAILRRVFGQLAYLSPSSILRVTAPLNLSYRYRLQANGTLRPGASALIPLSRPSDLHAEKDLLHPTDLS